MKYIYLLVTALTMALCACNNNDEPVAERNLPISRNYLPTTVTFSPDDKEMTDKLKGWADRQIIVNSLSELPDDPLGFSEAYTSINFSESTLLLNYNVHDWTIDTYRNRYYLDKDGVYNWSINIGTATKLDDPTTRLYFTRYAILVNKLPEDKDVRVWLALGSLNWDWD